MRREGKSGHLRMFLLLEWGAAPAPWLCTDLRRGFAHGKRSNRLPALLSRDVALGITKEKGLTCRKVSNHLKCLQGSACCAYVFN